MLQGSRRYAISIAAIVIAASTLTACTYSVAGGIIGGLSTLLVLGALFLFTSSQQGCDEVITQPCLSPPPIDADVGPCLSVSIDAGLDGGADAGDGDALIGPCLDVVPDGGADASPGTAPDPRDPEEPGEPGQATRQGEPGAAPSRGDSRADIADILDRLADRLPADVVARLRASGEDDRE